MRQLVISSPGGGGGTRDAETPEPGPGEVQVLTKVVGISGSEPARTGRRAPVHHLAMRARARRGGRRRRNRARGDRPARRHAGHPRAQSHLRAVPLLPIGTYNICERLRVVGCQATDAMADAFTPPASRFHVIPDSLSDAQAALVEPLSSALHAVRMARPLAGAAVAVLGAGDDRAAHPDRCGAGRGPGGGRVRTPRQQAAAGPAARRRVLRRPARSRPGAGDPRRGRLLCRPRARVGAWPGFRTGWPG